MPYADKEQQKQYQREWMTRRRTAWIASQGGACVMCGSTDRIEIDHIDPSEKQMNPTHLWSLKQADRDAELAKCQLLCHDCHAEKTYALGPIIHGTCGAYQSRGCRCVECKAWNQARVARWRAKQYRNAAPTRHAA